MVDAILFVHGYSESSLGAYFDFPKRVRAATQVPVTDIFVSAFDSLDDGVSISDLADALDGRIASLEARQSLGRFALVTHSTGALVARRWMVDRALRNRVRGRTPGAPDALALPSHFISMAGANHGSSLAQTGKSWLGYMQKLWTHQTLSVGKSVLTDLDYGSDFLLALNRQWLFETLPPDRLAEARALEGGALCDLLVFSMGGDSHGHDFGVNIFPPSAEDGSDNTVRISGANLNYTLMRADPEDGTIVALPTAPVAHHILRGYSHYGRETGVWGKTATPDLPVELVVEALACDAAGYPALRQRWADDLAAWTRENAAIANATLVFAPHDRSGRPVDDCSVVMLNRDASDRTATLAGSREPSDIADRNLQTIANLQNVSRCIVNEPIRNAVTPSTISFYLNVALYRETAPHYYHIEAASETPLVAYRAIDYTTGPSDDARVVHANEFTYVDVTMDRLSRDAYVIYPYADPLVTTDWNPPLKPFPPGYVDDVQAART
ncbi:MAG: hypothetical protein NVS2B3_04300 [Vulcanimicrobiaceae bacterium]